MAFFDFSSSAAYVVVAPGTLYISGPSNDTDGTLEDDLGDNFFTPPENIILQGGSAIGPYIGSFFDGTTNFVVLGIDAASNNIFIYADTALGDTTFPTGAEMPAFLTGLTTTPLLACFAKGTRIATTTGPVNVEQLGPGDVVLTAEGSATAVRWLGHRTTLTALCIGGMDAVCIKAGALGNGLPHTDLTVTGDHGMVIDGLVINASALINGTTIDWVPMEDLPDRVTYYHVETEDHDVILANGAPAETFVDYAGRQAFDNYQEYLDLYGLERIVPEMDRPRITSRRLVPEAIRARLGIVEPEIDWGAPLSA